MVDQAIGSGNVEAALEIDLLQLLADVAKFICGQASEKPVRCH